MIGHPIFDELPTPHVLFCPILLDPPSPPKIGHHLCMFPNNKIFRSNYDSGFHQFISPIFVMILFDSSKLRKQIL